MTEDGVSTEDTGARVTGGRMGKPAIVTNPGATLHLAMEARVDEIAPAYEPLRDGTLAGGSDRDAAVLNRLERLRSAYQSAIPRGGAAYRQG